MTAATSTRFVLAAERPQLDGLTPVAVVHAVDPTDPYARTACGRTLGDLTVLEDRDWPPPANRGLSRCEGCGHAVAASQATGEPITTTTVVEWLRSTGDAASEGGCSIGDRRYQGRAGERVQMREDDAQALAAAGFLRRVAGA